MTQLDRAAVAWGARSRDWAYLAESWLRPAYDRVLDRTAVGEGTRLVDIACGSGMAAMVAAQRGAQVSGLDAAEPLLRIARARVPEGDFRTGDMNALPFDDGSFDVVTSFNGIWHGWDQALSEARRVARPGAFVGLTFWGSPKRMGHWPWFETLAAYSTSQDTDALADNSLIGKPGVAEEMFACAGITVVERGTVRCWHEFPDVDTGWRALAAAGPSWPAVDRDANGYRAALTEMLTPLMDADVGIRLGSEIGYLIGRT